ncbi:hypothetical protein REPUB_Repub01dG0016400 [Reevesia pubescens]
MVFLLHRSPSSQLQSLASLKNTTQKNRTVAAVPIKQPLLPGPRFCSCGRRHFIEAATAALLPICPSNASSLHSDDYLEKLNKIHPPRPDWYEEFYASVMDTSMKSYEAEIAGYKSQIFGKLRGKAKRVLEIGIGTGPNLEYYANGNEVQVFGVDPNKKMEKYARAAAAAVGLPPKNFQFIEAVAEALPLDDASVDAVVGTLVLCSVKDVDMTLKEVKRVLKPGGLFVFVEHVAAKDGTILKFWQNVLDPLQQTVSDGCHLTRETGKYISTAGFSTKTGSLCCVAARPHGSNTASRDGSMGPHEPYWRTNTSFSPPHSRWDFRFQPEGLSYGSYDGIQLYGSSTSSNSKESRGWVRGNLLYNHQYSTSDGAGPFLSSPSDLSQGPQWTPPAIQEITLDDYETATRRDRVVGQLSFASIVEGTSRNADSGVSTSSHSDSSESEPMVKSCLSSHRNFSSRRYFMSKPIHPLSFPKGTPTTEASDSAVAGFSDDAATPHGDAPRWSSASSSSNEFVDVSEPFESEIVGRSCTPADGFKCALCEIFLSQRSPWSSRRIVRSSDMPVAGVLSCRHIFHAECLEQTTPKTHKNDPPCPICAKLEEQNSPENFSRFKNGFPKLKSFSEDGPSRPWGCAQVGDCVEGALHAPPRSTMLLLNRSRMKKNLFMKGNLSKEFPGKLRKSGSSSLQLFSGKSIDQGAVGCSKR